MIANIPYLRYDRHHHPIWVLKRLKPTPKEVVVYVSSSVILVATMTNTWGQVLNFSRVMIAFIGVLILPGARLTYLFIDWWTRNIRLYSDGRLDYEYGIFYREGQSVSMRFGSVHYRYPNRFQVWMNCADVVLPFGAGTITDIANFRDFWDIAQGRA